MSKTVLVSGASGIVGYGICRSLNERYNVIGTTIYDTSPSNIFSQKTLKAPLTNDKAYIPWLISVIHEYNISVIIPSIEVDMQIWNMHREELQATGVKIGLNNSELIKICENKFLFYKKMKEFNQKNVIPTYEFDNVENMSFPIIAKPIKGFGSKGIYKLNTITNFHEVKGKLVKDYIFQPIIGCDSEEYTVGAFFDFNSSLIDSISFKRKLSTDGYTSEAELVDIEINSILDELADIFKPIGPTNFQFRYSDKKFYLIEINPRISSSTHIRKLFNYNESDMYVNMLLGNSFASKISSDKPYGQKVIRYVEEALV